MYQVIIVFHVLLGIGVIGLVLMQQGKGADAGAAFGSGASGTVFGAQGAASFLSRTTAILATLFFITSLGLAVLSGHNGEIKDILDQPESEVSDLPLLGDETGPMKVPPISDTPVVDAVPTPEAQKQSEQVPSAAEEVDQPTAEDQQEETKADASEQTPAE
ncbi:MAG: preprotein translocase subunit SecG [Gammaproteobacteria bacterium]